MDDKELNPAELDEIAGGAPGFADDVVVMKCKTCGMRFAASSRREARKLLFRHVDEMQHEGSRAGGYQSWKATK